MKCVRIFRKKYYFVSEMEYCLILRATVYQGQQSLLAFVAMVTDECHCG